MRIISQVASRQWLSIVDDDTKGSRLLKLKLDLAMSHP